MWWKGIYKEGARPRPFLLALLFVGLSYGLYKGVLDNYMAEVAGIGEFDRGVVEFFRELPGLFLIVTLAILAVFSLRTIFIIGMGIMTVGLVMVRFLSPGKALLILAMTVYSFGEHLNLGMKSTISLDMANPLRGGESLGLMSSISNAGSIAGYLFVSLLFAMMGGIRAFHLVFSLAFLLQFCAFLSSFGLSGSLRARGESHRFYVRRKFRKYYMLEIFYGARKQVFLTFGPYVLILFYHASAAVVSLLFAICGLCGVLFAPLIGKLIDRIGYRVVMISDTLILVVVCFFYGFSHRLFAPETAFVVVCLSYVLDSIISLASLASNVYVKDISDSREEVSATISTGISVNHLISIIIALTGGYIWQKLGVEVLFTLSALLGIANSLYAASIPAKKGGRGI